MINKVVRNLILTRHYLLYYTGGLAETQGFLFPLVLILGYKTVSKISSNLFKHKTIKQTFFGSFQNYF